MRCLTLAVTGILATAAVTTAAIPARADDTIKRPGDHPHYHLEIEPHVALGWGGFNGVYTNSLGLGVIGGRIGIPIVENGFVPSINNSVAISFGFDAVYYTGCWDGFGNCSAWYLEFPATLQWNFYVSQHWSVFGEPGFLVYHGFFSDCTVANNRTVCGAPNGWSETGIYPAFFVGARYHFTDTVALTMRVGWPTFSIGVSFMP